MVTLTLDDFTSACGATFELTVDERTSHSIRLISAEPLPMPARHGRQPFSLVFEGPAQPVLAQRIYQLTGPDHDPVEIFLVPVGSDRRAVQYQAIFT